MPTKTKKLWLKAKREAKEARLLNAAQLERLRSGAFRVYGCACAYCQWREYNVIARRGDPGVNVNLAPAGCREPITVKARAAIQPL